MYGTGQVSGFLGTDTAHIASYHISLTFGLAYNVSSEFTSYPMDGILGLGRPNTASGSINAPSVMEALVSQGAIKNKLFGVHFWRSADGGNNDGEISFGSVNSAKFTGDLNYINTITNQLGFWEIPISDIGVQGKSLGLGGRTAIIDTGTSFILMPPGDAAKLHSQIPGSASSGEQFTVPCSSTATLQISFGGKAYTILARDYIGSQSSGDMCMSMIIGRQTFGANQWLMGVVFLKNVYTVFDADASRIGLGTKGNITRLCLSVTLDTKIFLLCLAFANIPTVNSASAASASSGPSGSGQSASNAASTGGSRSNNPSSVPPHGLLPAPSGVATTTSTPSGATAIASTADHNGAEIPWRMPDSILGLVVTLVTAVFLF